MRDNFNLQLAGNAFDTHNRVFSAQTRIITL